MGVGWRRLNRAWDAVIASARMSRFNRQGDFSPDRDRVGEFFEKIRPTSLIKRFTTPEEIATMVAYLASPLSSATDGAALRVDGGVVKSAF